MNKDIFIKNLTPKQKKMWDKEQKRLDDRRRKIIARKGKWCRHTATVGRVMGEKLVCLDCNKILDNPEFKKPKRRKK